jgi:hypothetical protein
MNFELLSEIFIELEAVDLLTLLSISPDALELATECYRQRVTYRQIHPEYWIASIDPLELGLTLEFVAYITPTTQLEWTIYNYCVDPIETEVQKLSNVIEDVSMSIDDIADQFNKLYPKMILFRSFLQDKIDQLCVSLFKDFDRTYIHATVNLLIKCLQIASINVVDQMKGIFVYHDMSSLITLFHDYGPFTRTHVQRYMEVFPEHKSIKYYNLGRMIKNETSENQPEQCTLFEEYFRQYPRLTDDYRRQFYTDLGRLSRNSTYCELTDDKARLILNRFGDSVYTYHEFANFKGLSWECFEYWWIHGYMFRYQQLKAARKSVKSMIPRRSDIKWSLKNFKGNVWVALYLTQLLLNPVTVKIPKNVNVISVQLLIQTGKIRVKKRR